MNATDTTDYLLHMENLPTAPQLVAILDNMSDAFCAVDREWRIVYANRKAQEIWGRSLQELLGKNLWEECPSVQNTGVRMALERAARERSSVTLRFASTTSERWWSLHAVPGEAGLSIYFSDITEGKETAEALERSNEYNRTIAGLPSESVFDSRVERDGTVVTENVSEGFTRQLGYTLDEMATGGGWQLLVHPEDLPKAEEQMVRLLEGEKIHGELRLVTRNGRVFWAEYEMRPVLNETGRVVHLYSAQRDISKRRQIQDELRLKEAQLALITDTTPVMMTYCNLEQKFLYVNRAYATFLGHAPEGIVGKSVREVLGEREYKVILPNIEKVLRGETVEFEESIPDEGKGVRFVRSTYVPARDANGQIQGWIASINDLTERRRTIQALDSTQEKYRRMFETMNEAVLVLKALYDESGNTVDFIYLDMNPAYEPIMGAKRSERVGHRASEFYTQVPFLDVFGRVAATRTPVFFETFQPYIQKYVQISAFSSEPDTITAIFSDITERKRAEQTLQEAHHQLEARVQERTRELARLSENRQQLLQQLVTAQEEERRRIARELHDQLGQLLTALGVGLKLLGTDGRDNATFGERVSQLTALTNQTSETVQSLAYELRPIALDDLGLKTTLENYLEEWSVRHRIQVHFEFLGAQTPRLDSNIEIAIYRIVQEALTNVLRHAAAKHISVVIERSRERLVTIIEDDGHGFAVDRDTTTTHRRESFGLMNMRERAEMLGGTFEIESVPNEGTTLFVRIPLHDSLVKE